MRLDEYQKWLDDQFLDTAPPEHAGSAVQTLTEAPPEPEMQPSSLFATEAVVEQRRSMEPEPQAFLPPMPEPEPIPQFSARQTAPDDSEVPSIESYLPFLRGSQPAPEHSNAAEVAPADTVEPVAPGAAEAVSDAGMTAAAESAGEPAMDSSVAEPFAAGPSAAVEAPPVELEMTAPSGAPAADGRAARPRKFSNVRSNVATEEITPQSLWTLVPKHIQLLIAMGSDEVTQNSYKRSFKESRLELINHLLDPTLTLEDTARLLNVCPTTVRRYTNKGMLTHQRTRGDQRRFKLSDVLAFLEAQAG